MWHYYKEEWFVLSSLLSDNGLIWIKDRQDNTVQCVMAWLARHCQRTECGQKNACPVRGRRLRVGLWPIGPQALKDQGQRDHQNSSKDVSSTDTLNTYPEAGNLGRGPVAANTGRIVRGLLRLHNKQSKVLVEMFFVYNLFLTDLLSNLKHGQV
ncbi:hypothetical protein ACFSQE_02430 [Vogesella fluminis]|uniref:hypothetical protein n=1 Tax=Vogesella fluminis TaxID=1069161 RepID=UPI00167BD63A|nr:hypothetical protein [Vogesella fluminis]